MNILPKEVSDAITKALVTYGRDVIYMWFAVIQRGNRAATEKDLNEPGTLLFSLAFLIYMGIFEKLFVLMANLGIPPERLLLSVLPTMLFEYCSGGLIFWFTFRRFGGNAALAPSFAAFAFMTAFLPLAKGAETLGLYWLALLLLIPFFWFAFRSLGTIHHLSGWRSGAAFVAGLAIYLLIAASSRDVLDGFYRLTPEGTGPAAASAATPASSVTQP